MDCQLNQEEVHTFTGVETTFKEEGMAAGGAHKVCFTTSVTDYGWSDPPPGKNITVKTSQTMSNSQVTTKTN